MTFYDPQKGLQTFGIFELTCEGGLECCHTQLIRVIAQPIHIHTAPGIHLCALTFQETAAVEFKSSGSGSGCCPNQFKPGLPQAFSVRRGPKKAQVKSSERNTCSFSTQCFPGRSAGSLKISSSWYITFESAKLSVLKTHLNKKFQRTKNRLGQISH